MRRAPPSDFATQNSGIVVDPVIYRRSAANRAEAAENVQYAGLSTDGNDRRISQSDWCPGDSAALDQECKAGSWYSLLDFESYLVHGFRRHPERNLLSDDRPS